MATTYTRKLIYCLQEANFTQSLFMTVAHEYWAMLSTRQHILARECQSVEIIHSVKVMLSEVVGECSRWAKQRSVRRKKQPRVFGKFQIISIEETSSPVAVPTATGKKLALPVPCSPSMEHSVSSPATDRTCSSDSLCEMKGLRLIGMQDLLASVTRRASCNVCESGLTVRENLGIRRGLCTKLTLSCTNPLCTGVEDAFSEFQVYSGRENVW